MPTVRTRVIEAPVDLWDTHRGMGAAATIEYLKVPTLGIVRDSEGVYTSMSLTSKLLLFGFAITATALILRRVFK